MSSRNVLLICSALLLAAAPSFAAMSGTEVSGNGWYSSNTFVSNFYWSVQKNEDNTWTYTYKFQPASIGRGAAFFSLEVAGNPTVSGTTTIPANPNPSYLDPTLRTDGPMSARWFTNGSGSAQTWTSYNYAGFSYNLKYFTTYSLADISTLDKPVTPVYAADGTTKTGYDATAVLSLPAILDYRPNPLFVNTFEINPPATGRMQYDAGSTSAGTVNSTMRGVTWFLPSQEYGVPIDKVNGGGANGGGGRVPGATRGYNGGWILSVTTTAAPMWGDFFLDGGDWKSDSFYLQGANKGYGGSAPPFVYEEGAVHDNMGFLPAPDFTTAPAPLAIDIEGSGTVNELDGTGPGCATAACSSDYPYGSAITLRATASAGYRFDGWGGACSGTGDCALVLDGGQEVSALFTQLDCLKAGDNFFATLQDAVNKAADGALVRAQALTFSEAHVVLDRAGVSLQLQGGYDSAFAASTGSTTLDGTLVIKNGTLRVAGFKIR